MISKRAVLLKTAFFIILLLMTTQLCIAIVIERKNKILIAQEVRNKDYEKAKGLWTIPAGKVNKQESLADAALREVKEETDLQVKLNGLIGVYQIVSRKNQALGVAFRARPIETKNIKSLELKNIKWVDAKKNALNKFKFRKGIKEVIEDYLKHQILPIKQVRFIK